MTAILSNPTELARALLALEEMRKREPSAFYQPHPGQEAFHRSTHDIRIIAAGNRFGKTLAGAVEADWYLQGTHRYCQVPKGHVQVAWICPVFGQMDKLRAQIESQALTAGWIWSGSTNSYTWPNESKMFIVSADSEWQRIQGLNFDLVICDEEPPIALWRELLTRSFGYRNGRKVRARYAITATASESESWMARELYTPWLKHHADLGLSESQAIESQSHSKIWCFPRGGIADNPMAEAADIAHYNSINWTSEEEKRVRMQGGFANFSGSSVFDRNGVQWIKEQAELLDAQFPGINGSLRAA